MSADRRKEIGQIGETAVAEELLKKGWQILHRNWSSRLGELDLIAMNQGEVVFVEVRTTRGSQFGFGFQSVDRRKQERIRRLALQYIQQHQLDHAPIRFDVASVLLDQNQNCKEIQYFEGAF